MVADGDESSLRMDILRGGFLATKGWGRLVILPGEVGYSVVRTHAMVPLETIDSPYSLASTESCE